MKLILQQVNSAKIHITDEKTKTDETRSIGKGVVIYLGIGKNDSQESSQENNTMNNKENNKEDKEYYKKRIDKFLDKFTRLKCRDDKNSDLNANIVTTGGEILLVSNFTLYAHYKNGNKMSFSDSARFSDAKIIYDYFATQAKKVFPDKVQTGEFGAMMTITSEISGPVNYILDI